MYEEIDEVEIKRKRRLSHQKLFAGILLVLIFAVPAVTGKLFLCAATVQKTVII